MSRAMKSLAATALLASTSIAAAVLDMPPAGAAATCKGGPACDKPPLRQACQDPESGVEYPKGYACVGKGKVGWQCEVGTGPGGTEKFYRAKGGGGKRKQDAICE
jgi:hypothetical protein